MRTIPSQPLPVEAPADNANRAVLIVDSSADARAVLRTALRRRGLATIEAADSEEGLRLAARHHPGVIVVDVEQASGDSENSGPRFDAQAQGDESSLVLLGTTRSQAQEFGEQETPQRQFVRKPYHYGPLIRQIEQLLTEQTSTRRAAA